MKRSLFWAAAEAAAKATRSGLSVVGALVDCGIPRQHAGAQWLTEFEEENEVLEAPLSVDFNDEPSCPHDDVRFAQRINLWVCQQCNVPASLEDTMRSINRRNQDSRTNAGATCNRAVEETSEGASPPAAPSDVLGVPTFKALEDICAKYIHQHWLNIRDNRSPYVYCTCGIELGSESQWIEHVAELQASALSFAIQDAQRRDHASICARCFLDEAAPGDSMCWTCLQQTDPQQFEAEK